MAGEALVSLSNPQHGLASFMLGHLGGDTSRFRSKSPPPGGVICHVRQFSPGTQYSKRPLARQVPVGIKRPRQCGKPARDGNPRVRRFPAALFVVDLAGHALIVPAPPSAPCPCATPQTRCVTAPLSGDKGPGLSGPA